MSSTIAARTLAVAIVLSAGVAHAQANSDAAIAQSLFDEGRKLMNEKKFPEACPRLERSYKLDPAPGTLLNLAVCHEAIGKTATAWNEFRDSLSMAKRDNRNDRLTFAQQHIERLKGRISTLTVTDSAHDGGLEWKLDGIKVGSESLGIALPIDPGTHTIEAIAPGKQAWKTSIEVKRDGETQTLQIPALVALPKQEPLKPVVVVVPEKSRGPSPWIWVTIGVGVVGYGALALGGIESLSSWSDRKKNCGIGGDPNACNQTGIDADKMARTWALVADIGLGVGAAATVATIIIAAVGRPKAKDAAPHVSVSPFGVSFSTSF